MDDISPVNDDDLSISEDTGSEEAKDATEANTNTEVEDYPENDAEIDSETENNEPENEEEEGDEAETISEDDD